MSKSIERTTEYYVSLMYKKKNKLLALIEEEKKYLYLSLHGDDMQKRNAKTALKGVRINIKNAKKDIQISIGDCEDAYSKQKILRFWNPSWKNFFKPLTI